MGINGVGDAQTENRGPQQTDQLSSASEVDMQKLAEAIFMRLLSELEIENERLGQA